MQRSMIRSRTSNPPQIAKQANPSVATTFTLSDTEPPKAARPFAFVRSDAFLPALAAIFVLALQLHLALTRSINWDEFHFLGQVHNFARGEFTSPMQTLHVRMFAWLAGLDMAGVDQIRIARLFMLSAEAVTCGAIVMIARRFVSLPYAIMCALAYLSSGYVMQHGWSFRTDPMATALSMSALAILARSKFSIGAIVGFALLMGTAFMVTIKIVLFAPAFAGIAWLRWSEAEFSIRRALQIAALPAAAMLVAAGLFYLHGLSLGEADDAANLVGHSGESMFIMGGSPNLRYMKFAFFYALPLAGALMFLPFAMGRRDGITSAEKMALIGLIAMAITPFYYLNTFPYFYAFLFAPIAAALGIALEAVSARYGRNFVTAIFAGWAMMLWVAEGESQLEKQRKIQVAATEMFDEPVAYFDFAVALPRLSKANNFLTTWGLKKYLNGLEPKYTSIMADRPVPMLLAMEPEINPSLLSAMEDLPRGFEFFPKDLAAFKSTYRPVWGPIYIAGLTLKPGETRKWHVWVPGPYKADAAIDVDGRTYPAGAVINLPRGAITVSAPTDAASGLLWGETINIPDEAAPQRPYWTDF